MKIGLTCAVVALAALAAAPAVAAPAAGLQRATVTAKQSPFGRVLFDGRGYVLYAFTRDPRGRSVCSGTCAAAWPPFVVAAAPRTGGGAAAPRIGTTRRRDGRLQATYAGRPLYYYVGDRKPGQILCQNVSEFGGLWLVVRASGKLVR